MINNYKNTNKTSSKKYIKYKFNLNIIRIIQNKYKNKIINSKK